MALSGTGVLWYIQVLWLLSLLLVVVRKIEKDHLWKLCEKTNVIVLILLGALVWGAAQILNTPLIVVYRFGLYGCVDFTAASSSLVTLFSLTTKLLRE